MNGSILKVVTDTRHTLKIMGIVEVLWFGIEMTTKKQEIVEDNKNVEDWNRLAPKCRSQYSMEKSKNEYTKNGIRTG